MKDQSDRIINIDKIYLFCGGGIKRGGTIPAETYSLSLSHTRRPLIQRCPTWDSRPQKQWQKSKREERGHTERRRREERRISIAEKLERECRSEHTLASLEFSTHSQTSHPTANVCVVMCLSVCVNKCAATHVLNRCRLAHPTPCSCRKGTFVKRWSSFYVFHWMTAWERKYGADRGLDVHYIHADKTIMGQKRDGKNNSHGQTN